MALVQSLALAGFEKITFAGGEPLLCPWVGDLIVEAKNLGMTTMMVSNGFRLNAGWLNQYGGFLDWFTFSIDSLDAQTNLDSGRADRAKRPMTEDEYKEKIQLVHNHGIRLKINTVVHKLNFMEDFMPFLRVTNPERWKIFQVLPVEGQNSGCVEDLLIHPDQFKMFVDRHAELRDLFALVPESNDDMTASYVMVDPAGRFFDNSKGRHTYSRPILKVGVRNALTDVTVEKRKFEDRGGHYDWNEKGGAA